MHYRSHLGVGCLVVFDPYLHSDRTAHREGIDPAKDGRPSNGVYREARAHYEQLLNARNICEPLLGDGSSMLRPTSMPRTTSRCSHGSRKQMAEESGESSRMKQARAA